MKIIRAQHLGMCFGVRDAIQLALNQNQSGPLTILGDLVHNETVLESLRANGIRMAQQVGQVQTDTVMITAHGASETMMQRVRDRGLQVLQATCPLVHSAHDALRGLVAQGYHPVIIGQAGHVEVRGMTEDLLTCEVVLSEAEVLALTERPRFGVVAQTTQPLQRVHQLVNHLRERFPQSEIKFVDTVCRPTKQRQYAAVELAGQADVVIVIGGANSNNTRELVQTCRQYCNRVHHVQTARDLEAEWFYEAETVGITAGTSTPDILIEQVEAAIHQLAPAHGEPLLTC